MRRICKCPLNSLKPLQQLSRRSETVCPSFQAARILSSSLEALCSLCLMQLWEQIALHVVHHARLAKSPPRFPWLKRFCTLPVRPHAAIRACLRCFCTAFTLSFSTCSVNVLLLHPHAGFGAYRRAAQKTRRKKGIQCHRSVNGAPPSSCRLWSRGAAGNRRNALDRKAFARRPRAVFRAFCPPKRADRRNELP